MSHQTGVNPGIVSRVRGAVVQLLRRTGLINIVTATSNRVIQVRKWMARSRGQDELSAVYNRRYFEHEESMTESTSSQVVDILREMFDPASVADIGCGTGVYLREFSNAGVAIRGVEASRDAIEHACVESKYLLQHDLREPLTPPSTPKDLVICFEVGEHLADEFSGPLVENIVGWGKTVVFSAAHPGQGGFDHVNEQPQSYWIERFRRSGFEIDAARTDELQRRFEEADVVWWLQTNAMVLRAAPTHGEN